MQVQFLDAPDFAIDRNGVLTRRSVWLLSNDDPATDISTAAAAWAGTISDPWKQPTSDGSSYTPDDSLQVTNIKCTALDSRTCLHVIRQRRISRPRNSTAFGNSF